MDSNGSTTMSESVLGEPCISKMITALCYISLKSMNLGLLLFGKLCNYLHRKHLCNTLVGIFSTLAVEKRM